MNTNLTINVNTIDPQILGELLRNLTFTDDGFGCYENFDVREGFVPITDIPKFFYKEPVHEYNSAMFDDTIGVKAYTNLEWNVYWQWDGDGTLIFEIGDFYLYNDDCKKALRWTKFHKNNLKPLKVEKHEEKN
jgi:hypothetical protein